MISKDRGFLCESIQEKAKKFLGEEITQKELRLYPFIDYTIKNGGYLDRSKIDDEERKILNERISQRHIFRSYDGYIFVSREFYDFMQDVLADSYVTFMEDVVNET